MMADDVAIGGQIIPLCVTECCREWIAPYPPVGGGSCGICGERPTFVRVLPESEWLRVRPPIRPESLV